MLCVPQCDRGACAEEAFCNADILVNHGEEAWELLAVCEFDSDRKRQSVVLRNVENRGMLAGRTVSERQSLHFSCCCTNPRVSFLFWPVFIACCAGQSVCLVVWHYPSLLFPLHCPSLGFGPPLTCVPIGTEEILVMCKGADEKVIPLCNAAPYTDETLSHLLTYAKVHCFCITLKNIGHAR